MTRSVRKKGKREHPVSMRLAAADIAIIDHAAGLRGRSRSDFVRDAAVREAEAVLMEKALIRMSPGSFASFMAAIAAPGRAVPQMVELFERAAPWENTDAKS